MLAYISTSPSLQRYRVRIVEGAIPDLATTHRCQGGNRSPAGGAPIGAQLATTATSTVVAIRHLLMVGRIISFAQAYLSRYRVSLDCVRSGGAGEIATSSRYHLSTTSLEIAGAVTVASSRYHLSTMCLGIGGAVIDARSVYQLSRVCAEVAGTAIASDESSNQRSFIADAGNDGALAGAETAAGAAGVLMSAPGTAWGRVSSVAAPRRVALANTTAPPTISIFGRRASSLTECGRGCKT